MSKDKTREAFEAWARGIFHLRADYKSYEAGYTAQAAESEALIAELAEALVDARQFFPMQLVQGDCAQMYNPNQRQMLNTNACWLVPSNLHEKSAVKLRNLATETESKIEQALQRVEAYRGKE